MQTLDKKERAKELWRHCFHDPEAFIELYFRNVYKDENTLLRQDSETNSAVAHVQMLPYTLQAKKSIALPSGYISGACTIPSQRGKGIMTELMHQALEQMAKRGDKLSFLIPAEQWLVDYYERAASYVPTYGRSRLTFNLRNSTHKKIAESIISRYQACQGLTVRHTKEQYQVVGEDLRLSGYGGMQGEAGSDGLIFYLLKGQTLQIKGLTPEISLDTLTDLMRRWEAKAHWIEALVPCLNINEQSEAKAMIRILDVEAILQAYPHLHNLLPSAFVLEDPQLKLNCGIYRRETNLLVHLRENDRTDRKNTECSTSKLPRIGIGELTRLWVHSTEPSFFNLLLD